MKVYLIRHTAVDVPAGICYGQTDVPLKKTFEAEAEKVKQRIADAGFDAVYSSPLSRCRRLANHCGFENATLDDRLKELNFGDWEMGKWHELDMTSWDSDWVNVSTPNGEAFLHLYNRLTSFLDDLKTNDYDKVAVFTHGGIISAAKSYFGQQELKHAFDDIVKYGEVVEFEL